MGKIIMKKFLLGTIGLVAMGLAPAMAADLPARAPVYTKAPAMVAPIYDWTGFYIGVNGGGGWSHKCWDVTNILGVTLPTALSDGCHNATGGVAGGQIGYRWQSASWVFGLEAAGDWANLKGSNSSPLLAGTIFNVTDQSKINALGFFTGQVGYAWNAALLYVKGGAAVTGTNYNIQTTLGNLNVASASATRWGGTIGVGFEYGFAPNWSAGLEYDHLFMGNRSVDFTSTGALAFAPVGTLFRTDTIHQNVDMITARINYRFGGPVVAKY